MAEVAVSLQKISKSKLNVDLLYQEVMKTVGFEEDFLASVFDHLVERKNLANDFLAKSDKLRKFWIEKFKENNRIMLTLFLPTLRWLRKRTILL